jgi:glycosyltransferase involved in cell wall biosynthesis
VARKHGALVIRHGTNLGKGAAMSTGAKAANGDAIVFLDADGQFDPSQVPLLVSQLGRHDMVIGTRDLSVVPWNRQVTNMLTKLGLFLATGRGVSDPLSGFRAVRKGALMRLKLSSSRFEVEYEMLYKALKAGFRIAEVPVSVRYLGGSKLNFKSGAALIRYIVRSVLGFVR